MPINLWRLRVLLSDWLGLIQRWVTHHAGRLGNRQGDVFFASGFVFFGLEHYTAVDLTVFEIVHCFIYFR